MYRQTLHIRHTGMSALRATTFLIVALPAVCAAALQEAPAVPPTPDANVVGTEPERSLTPAQVNDRAWSMLTTAVTDEKHPDTRIQALAALGLLGSNARSLRLIHDATTDKDLDIRTAAVLASGETKSPAVTTDLRQMLDDREPQVAFSAALTLWRLHDRSGEDILVAVASGGRSATPKLMRGAEHSMSRQLHNPAALARDGALQGASMLLGPFGMGITALEYLRKNGGDSARVQAIEAIAENHTGPIRETLLTALEDRDLGVRAAAAKALVEYHDPVVAGHIARLFLDPKPPVRLTAAAAYIACSTGSAAQPKTGRNRTPGL